MQTEPKQDETKGNWNRKVLNNLEGVNALNESEKGVDIGKNDHAPQHDGDVSLADSLLRKELFNQRPVVHVDHLTLSDGLNFFERFLVEFGLSIPPHVLEAVGNAGLDDGVHSFHGVLKEKPAHQHRGESKFPSRKRSNDHADEQNTNARGHQASIDLGSGGVRVEDALRSFLLSRHGGWMKTLMVKIPLLRTAKR